jgi:TonB family protein
VSPSTGRRTFIGILSASLLPCARGLAAEKADDKSSTDSDRVYEIGGDVKGPKLVYSLEPDYKPDSKDAYAQGVVRLSTVVTHEGTVRDVQVKRGLTPKQDKAAVEAVKKWRFEPGTRNGEPVNVRVAIEVEFNLL